MLLTLNLALAGAMHLLAPAEPRLNDRDAYDYVAAHPFAANCPFSIYCYRPLAPVVVHQLPFEPDTSWRVYQVASNTAAGAVIAIVAGTLSTAPAAPFLASVMAQTSYGFTFTAYDPYAADPMVFLIAALLAWCWITNRPWAALGLSALGIFVKETVALLAMALALASLLDRRPGWKRWLVPALVSGAGLAAFHIVTRVWLNWEIASNPAAQLSHGSWIGLWWRNNPLVERKAYMLFATFGFGWVFAVLGWRVAPLPWRALALATIAPMLPLMIAQTPERALGNAFYVVVPLAVLRVSRAPALAGAAVALNALVTAKAGSSSLWLPSARWTLVPAALAALACMIAVDWKSRRIAART